MTPLPENLAVYLRSFQESRILLSAIELDLFTAIRDGARAPEAAARIGADARATEMLMNALVALGALTKRDGVFRNTPAAADHFAGDSRLALMHNVNLWTRWSCLTESVRQGTAVNLVDLEQRDAQWIAAFIAAMQLHSIEGAPVVAAAVDTSRMHRILDVGGGSGAYSIAFTKANSNLRAVVFDLKPVLAITRTHIERAGLTGRVSTQEGNLHTDPFGEGFDMVFISSICHMLSPEANTQLFRKAFAALNAGGSVVMRDFILEDDKTAPRQAAVFALNMLVGTRDGASYSQAEYRAWMEEAGFTGVRHVELSTPASLMIGVNP